MRCDLCNCIDNVLERVSKDKMINAINRGLKPAESFINVYIENHEGSSIRDAINAWKDFAKNHNSDWNLCVDCFCKYADTFYPIR